MLKYEQMPVFAMEDLYHAMVNKPARSVFGKDFNALNYGKTYSMTFNGKERLIIISGDARSYMSSTPERGFPDNAEFSVRGPRIPIREASHVTDCKSIRSEISLDEFVELLRDKGMRFA